MRELRTSVALVGSDAEGPGSPASRCAGQCLDPLSLSGTVVSVVSSPAEPACAATVGRGLLGVAG